jgi:hypothetical protein
MTRGKSGAAGGGWLPDASDARPIRKHPKMPYSNSTRKLAGSLAKDTSP